MTGHDKTTFWNNKILQWEEARYQGQVQGQTVLEKLVKGGGGSIRHRLDAAVNLLRPHLRGRSVLDVGCGSGLLFQQLSGCGASHFIGIDLAPSAVSKGEQLAGRLAEPTSFLVGNATQMELPPCDVVVGLGLLDWLSDLEIETLFGKISGKRFLFSISEKRWSVSQLFHRWYVYLSYGRKDPSYVPRYDSVAGILSLLGQQGFERVEVVRHKSLSFGVLLHNLGDSSLPS